MASKSLMPRLHCVTTVLAAAAQKLEATSISNAIHAGRRDGLRSIVDTIHLSYSVWSGKEVSGCYAASVSSLYSVFTKLRNSDCFVTISSANRTRISSLVGGKCVETGLKKLIAFTLRIAYCYSRHVLSDNQSYGVIVPALRTNLGLQLQLVTRRRSQSAYIRQANFVRNNGP